MRIDLAKLAAAAKQDEANRRRRKWPKWYKIPHELPGELAGSLQVYRVRCGKPRCRCASRRPDDAHEATFRVWHEGGRMRKQYVRAGEVEHVRQAIERRAARLAIDRAKRNRHMRRGMGKRKGLVERVRERQLRGGLGSMYETYMRVQRLREKMAKKNVSGKVSV